MSSNIIAGYVKQATTMDKAPWKQFISRDTWAMMHAASRVEQQEHHFHSVPQGKQIAS